MLLVIDPVFFDLSQSALLDLGQAVFALAYVLVHLYFPTAFILQGILLGAFAASKFWSTTLFFIAAVATYRIMHKKWHTGMFFGHIIIGFITFCLIYLHAFIAHAPFNIIFYQLKTLKYWFNHSVSSVPGDAILLFLTGQHHIWWQNNELIRVIGWPPMWPISASALILSAIILRKKRGHYFFLVCSRCCIYALLPFRRPTCGILCLFFPIAI
ncbi:MAG: hypothetical protein UZ22_OP11002000464 [Microgenomates bacterium OLB23]|nr:MAG: hypothetical protein UZ22_OP11002000464 [Microgenomates bacterium OLB23]